MFTCGAQTVGLLMSSSVHVCSIYNSWNFSVCWHPCYPSERRRNTFLKMFISFQRHLLPHHAFLDSDTPIIIDSFVFVFVFNMMKH